MLFIEAISAELKTLVITISFTSSIESTADSEVLCTSLQNDERLDDAIKSTFDKGEAVQHVQDKPPPDLKRFRNVNTVIESLYHLETV